MITLTDIELRRGTKVLLQDAELVVHPGQHIGIIGANGSGKSSLFKLLMGKISADAGELFIPQRLARCPYGAGASQLREYCCGFCSRWRSANSSKLSALSKKP